MSELLELQKRVTDLETAVTHTQDRLESTIKHLLPSVTNHLARVTEGLAQQTLQMDVHRRKWNVIIHGIDGPAGEGEEVTRAASIDFARDKLKVADADSTRISACHRLSKKVDAGVIVRFTDLAQRDKWLAGAVHLKNINKKVTVSPDLPPAIRPLN